MLLLRSLLYLAYYSDVWYFRTSIRVANVLNNERAHCSDVSVFQESGIQIPMVLKTLEMTPKITFWNLHCFQQWPPKPWIEPLNFHIVKLTSNNTCFCSLQCRQIVLTDEVGALPPLTFIFIESKFSSNPNFHRIQIFIDKNWSEPKTEGIAVTR